MEELKMIKTIYKLCSEAIRYPETIKVDRVVKSDDELNKGFIVYIEIHIPETKELFEQEIVLRTNADLARLLKELKGEL